MQNTYFQKLEKRDGHKIVELSEVINHLAFNHQGLIPVVTQDASNQEVLMVAWMNKQALNHTLKTGYVTYWSRSRNELWIKGETSGHKQQLVSMSFDCDGDTVLCQVNQTGPACHTGRRHCFYLNVDRQQQHVSIEQ